MAGAFASWSHENTPQAELRTVTRVRLICLIFWSSCGCGAFAADVEPKVVVEVAGIDGELKENALAHLSIAELTKKAAKENPEAAPTISEDRVRRLHAAAPQEIEQALQPFGCYEVDVRPTLRRSDDGGWVARYDVDPGKPTLLDEVEINVLGAGRDEPDVREALDSSALSTGQVLRHQQYEATKERLFNAAYKAGYIDANYRRAEILVHPREREAEVHLDLDTGQRYYFGELTIEQDILSSSLVSRFVSIGPGEPFDSDRLIDLQLALSDSGYFSNVTIDVRREEAVDRQIPVIVHTTPRKTQEYTVGMGYGTDTGPRLSLGMELRRLNLAGHRFHSDLRVSGITTKVAAEYRIPVKNVATDTLSYSAALGTEEFGDLDTDAVSIGATWNDSWRRLQRRLYVLAQREDWEESSNSFSETLLYPGMNLRSQLTGDALFVRRGHSWSSDIRGASDALGSSTSFLRLHATGGIVRPIGDRARFLFRSEYGAIDVGEFSRLPPSQRFFAGGDRSVRGYRYQKLGPTDSNGATVGGRYLLIASAELDYLFVGNYGAALFFDAGNAANEPWPDLKRSVGVGFRWRSPFGMVRVDVAHPLDDPDTDYRLHLSIGSDL
jgi:translocation and assembly module TamA